MQRKEVTRKMLEITVQYLGVIQDTIGIKKEKVSLSKKASVRDLLYYLGRRHGKTFRDHVFAPTVQEYLNPEMMILVDGVNINQCDGLDTKLEGKSKASIAILPVVTGG